MTATRTVPTIKATKRRNGGESLVMVTAYDAPSARVATEANVDLILVGDSVAMVVLGHDNTLQVTVEELAYHTAAVTRTNPTAVVVSDMPWMSFHVSVEETVRNAALLIRAGASCVKIEGGAKRLPMIKAILNAEIPVMAHIGLTPQSSNIMGGFKIQGRDAEAVYALVDDAKQLEAAGCFAILVEGVPDAAGKLITDAIEVPTIGIGAGADTDGQVLVYHDIIGLENRFKPRFVRRYGTAYEDQVVALSSYAQDVRSGDFPSEDEMYLVRDDLAEALGLYGGTGSANKDANPNQPNKEIE